MTRKRTLFGSKTLALAAIVATGMAATPFALTNDLGVAPNSAAARQAANSAPYGTGVASSSHENFFQILGTTAAAAKMAVPYSAETPYGPLGEYRYAIREGNLDRAAGVLATIAKVPITPNLVRQLDTTLAITSPLSAVQVADAAAAKKVQAWADLASEQTAKTSHAALNTGTVDFSDYKVAMTVGDLDAAGQALDDAINQPITRQLVRKVDHDLGIKSTLTAREVANAAAAIRAREAS